MLVIMNISEKNLFKNLLHIGISRYEKTIIGWKVDLALMKMY